MLQVCDLYSNHTETIIKYFVTNLINHITTEQEWASRLLMPAFENEEREWQTKCVNFQTLREENLACPYYNRFQLDPFSTFHDA